MAPVTSRARAAARSCSAEASPAPTSPAARQAGRHDRLAGELDALHAAASRGGVGHARAEARRRTAAPDVPARGAGARHATLARRTRRRQSGPRRSPGPAGSRYERLVVALGAVNRVVPVPGLAEHGLGFKDLADGIALRNHVLRRLEAAAAGGPPSELGFVFVGAGYAGVEALGELDDLARDGAPLLPDPARAPQRWVLVDAAPTILRRSRARLGEVRRPRARAARRRDPRRRDARSRTTARRPCSPGGTTVPARTLVWTAGVKASPLLREFGLPLDERGRVASTRRCGSRGWTTCGRSATTRPCPTCATPGKTDPPTCQHALRQARRLAKNLTGDAAAVRLPDARPGRNARPLQGNRRRDGDAVCGFPGLVRRPHVPPLRPAAPDAGSSGCRPTGRSPSSSAATSPSSRASGTPRASSSERPRTL